MAGYVLVGGGVAATQAAETIRKLDPSAGITLIAEEERPFYVRPLLADFLAGRIEETRLWRNFPEIAKVKKITLITGKSVVGVDRPQRSLKLSDGSVISYDKLLVATGVKPRLPEITGADLDGVTVFSSYADAVRLSSWAADAKSAVVIGRGLQGVELTRGLRLRGLSVIMVVPDESPWFPQLFQVKGEVIEQALSKHGVEVIPLDRPVELLGEGGRVIAVKTERGRRLPADIVGFALEQRACFEFLEGSGISLADGIIVDAHLRSTDEHVFAAGDVAQLERDGIRRPLGYGWLRAMAQGEAAGRSMVGEEVMVEVGGEAEAQALYGMSLLARWG